jgi:hypothetical protein
VQVNMCAVKYWGPIEKIGQEKKIYS